MVSQAQTTAIYVAPAVPLVVFSPREDDGFSPTVSLGLTLLLILARGAFVWWWDRRPGADLQRPWGRHVRW